MQAFWFLALIAPCVLIVGLFKPAWVLPGVKRPSRANVIISAGVIMAVIAVALIVADNSGTPTAERSTQAPAAAMPNAVQHLATASEAVPPNIGNLIKTERELDDRCRGGSGDDEATQKYCDERDKVVSQLKLIGWCYGSPGQAMYQMEWHPCGTPSATGVSRAFTVTFDVPVSFDGPIIQGTTNLPDGMQLMVSLQTPAPACQPHCNIWMSHSTVNKGRFTSGPFGANPGTYTLKITTSIAELGTAEVQAIIGLHGENLRGAYVTPELIPGAGPTIDYTSQIEILARH